MNILITTSSYPAHPEDASGTAGLFVRDFALALQRLGHKVVVQPVARKQEYVADPELTVEPLPWKGGDRELASLDLRNPVNWFHILHLYLAGRSATLRTVEQHDINYILAMWVLPSGLFGLAAKRERGIPFDVWALGSDIWKVRGIPVVGKPLLRSTIQSAINVYADGMLLSREVEAVAGTRCTFLPSSRKLPTSAHNLKPLSPSGRIHFLFVGRYHANKGPDLLLQAVATLPDQLRSKIFVHLFGLGPMEPALHSLQGRLALQDCVRIGGPVESQDYADLLQRADFLAIPSRIDSIPLAFSDALQCGTPVVAMPVGDLSELIPRYGCGEIAHNTSAVAFSDAIQRAVQAGPSAYFNGVRNALGTFDIDRAAKHWIDSLPVGGALTR